MNDVLNCASRRPCSSGPGRAVCGTRYDSCAVLLIERVRTKWMSYCEGVARSRPSAGEGDCARGRKCRRNEGRRGARAVERDGFENPCPGIATRTAWPPYSHRINGNHRQPGKLRGTERATASVRFRPLPAGSGDEMGNGMGNVQGGPGNAPGHRT